MQERKCPLSHRLSGVSECRVNVLRLQIGKRSKNVLLRHSFRNHADDGRHGNPQAANARHAVHLLRIDGDSAHGYVPDKGAGLFSNCMSQCTADGVMTPGGVYHRRSGCPPSASACYAKKHY